MSKNEVRIRLSLGPDYENMSAEAKYEYISGYLSYSRRWPHPKSVKEALLGELRRVETELGWPHRRYNSPDRGELPPVGQ